jgi:hypothetical protein
LFRSTLAGTIQRPVEAYRIVPKAVRPGGWPPAGMCHRRTVGTVRFWSGLGRAMVLGLAQAGIHVVATAAREPRAGTMCDLVHRELP